MLEFWGGARADGMMGFITPKWGISDTCSALVQRLNHVADGRKACSRRHSLSQETKTVMSLVRQVANFENG